MITKITRGCGTREPGGLYACCGTSPYGKPIEEFLIDPPMPFKGKPFRAPVTKEKDDVKHLIIWVGEQFYPYCPDFIEETRRYGASRRIPFTKDFDFEGFVPFKSRMYFIHPRAIITNEDCFEKVDMCPKNKPEHLEGKEFCIRSLYYFVQAEPEGGQYAREIGDTRYYVPWVVRSKRPEYMAGMFLNLPFTHFEYVRREDGSVEPRIEEAVKDGKSITVVDE